MMDNDSEFNYDRGTGYKDRSEAYDKVNGSAK